MAAEGLRCLHGPGWYQSGPGLVPVRAGLVIDFCTSPVRTGNSTYLRHCRCAGQALLPSVETSGESRVCQLPMELLIPYTLTKVSCKYMY